MNKFLGTLLKHQFAKLVSDTTADAKHPQCAPTQAGSLSSAPLEQYNAYGSIISMRTGKPIVLRTLVEIINQSEGRYFKRRSWTQDYSVRVVRDLFETSVASLYEGRSPIGFGRPSTHSMSVDDVLATDWELAPTTTHGHLLSTTDVVTGA